MDRKFVGMISSYKGTSLIISRLKSIVATYLVPIALLPIQTICQLFGIMSTRLTRETICSYHQRLKLAGVSHQASTTLYLKSCHPKSKIAIRK